MDGPPITGTTSLDHLTVDCSRPEPTDAHPDALLEAAAAGATVVVVAPPRTDRWERLVGARVLAAADHDEVVVEPTSDPLARNLAEQVRVGGVVPMITHDGTRDLVRTRLSFGEQSVATVRDVGAGRVVALGAPPRDDVQPDADVLGLVRDRAVRRVDESTAAATVGVGIVGYGQHGGMGWLHGTAVTAVEGLHLAAIAETHPGRLEDAGARFGEVALHADIEPLLDDDDVAVVLVATPPSTHHALAARALDAGKHVVVEKPLCFTAAEADDLLGRAEDAALLLTVHQNRRWDADFRAIRRLVASGRLGEVFNVETFVGGFEHPCRLWHSEISVSGGRLYDWGAHLIDQQLRLLGAAPTTVTATGHGRVWHDVTNLDQVRVRLAFDDGREAEFLDSDVLAVRRPKYLVQGTRGTLVGTYSPVVEESVTPDRGHERVEHHHAEGPARLRVALHEPGWGLHETDVPVLPAPPHAFHRGLADHLQLGDPVPVAPTEVRDLVAVLEAAHTSAHDGGRPVRPA